MGRPCQPRPDGPSMRMHAAALGVIPKLEPETRVAGSLIAKVWTDERPTEPGNYWLSLPPSDRRSRHACLPVVINAHGDLMTEDLTSAHFRYAHMTNQNPDGAKWSRRETPADPFEVTG